MTTSITTTMLFASLGSAALGWIMFLLSVFLILLVLVQRGKGGGLTGALGGPGGQSAFGSKAGDTFTLITAVSAIIWGLVCAIAMYTLGTPPLTADDMEYEFDDNPAVTSPADGDQSVPPLGGGEAASGGSGLSGLSGLLSDEPGETEASDTEASDTEAGDQAEMTAQPPTGEAETSESETEKPDAADDSDATPAEDAASGEATSDNPDSEDASAEDAPAEESAE